MRRSPCPALVLITVLLSGCTFVNQAVYTQYARPSYQSYKEIPGVTQDVIDALEKLLANKPRLTYGVIVTTEAFLYEDGSGGGFAALFGNRLTQPFGFVIDYYPCSSEERNKKIASKEIDLAGDFTATPERQQRLFMTDAINQRTFGLLKYTGANMNKLMLIII